MIGRLSAARRSTASSTASGEGAGHGARGSHPGSPCSHIFAAAALPGLPSPGAYQRDSQQPGLQHSARDNSPTPTRTPTLTLTPNRTLGGGAAQNSRQRSALAAASTPHATGCRPRSHPLLPATAETGLLS